MKTGDEEAWEVMMSFAGVVTMAHIISHHFEYTRYPDKEIKPYDYDQSFGVVQTLPISLENLEMAAVVLKKHLERTRKRKSRTGQIDKGK